MGREEVDEQEHGSEPAKLSREVHERAAAVDAGDTRVAIKEPVQRRVKASRVEDGRGPEKGEVARELGERIGDEERVGESGTAERSRWERSRLDDG